MAGEWLTATANTNMFTYEIAPVFILMENVVLTKMREIIGWKTGDSIFAPGDILLIYICNIDTPIRFTIIFIIVVQTPMMMMDYIIIL